MIRVNYFVLFTVHNKQLIVENNEENENDDDFEIPSDNNFPNYVNALQSANCSDDHILRFDCAKYYDLKIGPSALTDQKGLFAYCDIPTSNINNNYKLDAIISYYWGKFMTNTQVKYFYDARERESHRLMQVNFSKKYTHVDGDKRCAATYINDPIGLDKEANAEYVDSFTTLNELDCIVAIKTIREIKCGEEIFACYGDKFFSQKDSLLNNNVIQLFNILE